VQARCPQCFVSVNVADATDQDLIEQCALDFGVLGPKFLGKALVIKGLI
jgi:hypothetical protein